jgi:hypothetical protein
VPRPRCRGGRDRLAAGLVRLAVLLVACSDPTAGPAKLSGHGVPTYRAPRASGPIAVDGRLDEPAWRSAPEAELFNSLTGGPLHYPTTARILWDRENLYVGFTCRDDEAWSRPGRRDGDAIYEDEVVEVFVDPAATGQDYAEIEVSPANVRFDARFRSWRSDLAEAVKWQSGARTAVRVEHGPDGDRGWTVEMAIPLDALRGRAPFPRPGDRWRLNLYRLESHNRAGWQEGGAFSPPLRGDFHALDRFGWLVFD